MPSILENSHRVKQIFGSAQWATAQDEFRIRITRRIRNRNRKYIREGIKVTNGDIKNEQEDEILTVMSL